MNPQYMRRYSAYEPPPPPVPQFSSQTNLTSTTFDSEAFFKAGEIAAKREAEAAAVKEVSDRIAFEQALASATKNLLTSVKYLVIDGSPTVSASTELARFRKELQPLAETYGLRIVLVGDRTTATLVK